MARVFDTTLLILALVLVGLMVLAWMRGGSELVWRGLEGGGGLLARYALVIGISFLAAGFADVLIPDEWVRRNFGEGSGLRGIAIASAAGAITPAGPFVSMPIAAVMLRAGSEIGPVVAYLTGWSLLALHRLIAWEVPILGWNFALLRWGASLLLPVLAGLLARWVSRAL